MSLSSVANNVKRLTGLVDDATVLTLLDLAGHEIWDSVDLPGELREVQVTTDAERFVTLPSDVYRIRGIRSVYSTIKMEITPVANRYNEGQEYQNHWSWRMLHRTPLQQRITNASKLTFRAKKPLTARCTITLGGPTALGERVYETIVIQSGQQLAYSAECYLDVVELSKDATTVCDIEVKDADSALLTQMPNHLKAPSYWLVQVRECGAVSVSCADCKCFDILYKPVLPPFESLDAYWPIAYEQVLLFKALEHAYLAKEDMIGVSKEYNGKALALLSQFQQDEAAGKTIRPNVRRSPFQTRPGATL